LGHGPTRNGGTQEGCWELARKARLAQEKEAHEREGKKKQTGQAQGKQRAGLNLPGCVELKKNSVFFLLKSENSE
jgi:hypothetical protein